MGEIGQGKSLVYLKEDIMLSQGRQTRQKLLPIVGFYLNAQHWQSHKDKRLGCLEQRRTRECLLNGYKVHNSEYNRQHSRQVCHTSLTTGRKHLQN